MLKVSGVGVTSVSAVELMMSNSDIFNFLSHILCGTKTYNIILVETFLNF